MGISNGKIKMKYEVKTHNMPNSKSKRTRRASESVGEEKTISYTLHGDMLVVSVIGIYLAYIGLIPLGIILLFCVADKIITKKRI